MSDDLRSSNLTFQILSKAQREGYGILAQSWYISFDLCALPLAERMYSYDAQSAIALVRAAERNRSPAILQAGVTASLSNGQARYHGMSDSVFRFLN